MNSSDVICKIEDKHLIVCCIITELQRIYELRGNQYCTGKRIKLIGVQKIVF